MPLVNNVNNYKVRSNSEEQNIKKENKELNASMTIEDLHLPKSNHTNQPKKDKLIVRFLYRLITKLS
jgi:hypothetical protein